MGRILRVNPAQRQARDQSVRVVTAAVAGPALLYAGYRFPGTGATRALLMALGAAMTYTHYGIFREELDGEEYSDEDPRLIT